MKKLTVLIIAGLLMTTGIHAQVAEKLKALGMENIRLAETEGTTTVAFEDNVYRGTYRGIGQAIASALDGMQEGTLEMVALENSVPQLSIVLPAALVADYKTGTISIKDIYACMELSYATDEAMERLKPVRETVNGSAWKVDIVLYPDIYLENSRFDKLYAYEVNLAPAVELSPWKGAMVTAQVIFPIATNRYGEAKQIRPGVITLSQEFRLKNNFLGRFVAGNFTNNRIGMQAEMGYRADNGRWELGARVGTTGYSAVVKGEGWVIGEKQRVNAALKGSLYEPRFNLQMDLQVGRFVYGDYGVRGDCTRHFGEYAIGVYAACIEGEVNGGFHFAIPLPGKKWKRNKAVRLRPAQYFAEEYSMRSWGTWIDDNLGATYSTRPNENRSERFYQPEYIRYFLLKEAEKSQ